MEMHEKTSYFAASLCGLTIAAWFYHRGEPVLKGIGAALMISSAVFLFVGFFSKPKYEFGKSTILFNAMLAADKLEELEKQETQHHKHVLAQRILEGLEKMPTKGRLNAFSKDELIELCNGLEISSEGTKKEMIDRLHESWEW